MYKLIAVTLTALYFVLLIFGDETRRPDEVARAEPLGLELVTAAALPADNQTKRVLASDVTERQAIELAIAAGKKLREERRATPEQQRVAVAAGSGATIVESAQPQAQETSYWYVTGSRVNLRGGPGTGNAVVGQATQGAAAEVLTDQDGWYQIRLADGSASGWIFGKFLNENRPG